MIMAKARRNGGKPVRVVTDAEGQVESNSMLARIQPVGVQEDGRMYYMSDMGHLLTVRRMPYLALRSISRSLENHDSSVYKFLLGETDASKVNSVLENFHNKTSDSGKKCERAFERLKAKGLYTDKIRTLRDMIYDKLPLNLNWPLDVILDMSLGLNGMDEWDADIPDDVWLSAIELSMYMHHRQEYMDSGDELQWGLYVANDIEFLWMLVLLITYGNLLRRDMGLVQGEISQAKRRLEEIAIRDDNIANLEAELRANEISFDKTIERTQRECDALRSENVVLVRENKKLSAKFELMEASMIAADEEASQVFELDESESDDVPVETFAYDLPESNVLFVGGHPRLQNKLKQLHPKWKFITTRMSYRLLDDNVNARFVFLYTGHMTHKLFDKVMDSLGTVPMAYVSSQNLTRLHMEMLRAYNEHMESCNPCDF